VANRDVFDRDALVFSKIPEVVASECRVQISYDAIWQAETMYNIFEQVGCLLCGQDDKRLVLNPLIELINSDIHIFETCQSWFEGSDHVQSLAYERPRCRHGFKGLS